MVRVRLEPGDKLGHRADWYFPADDQGEIEPEDLGDRQQVDQRVIAEVRIDMRMERDQAARRKEQGCSIRSRILDGAQSDPSAGPRSIVDDYCPAEALLQMICKHSCDGLLGATGRKREYDLEGLLLCAGRSRPQSEKSETGQSGPRDGVSMSFLQEFVGKVCSTEKDG